MGVADGEGGFADEVVMRACLDFRSTVAALSLSEIRPFWFPGSIAVTNHDWNTLEGKQPIS